MRFVDDVGARRQPVENPAAVPARAGAPALAGIAWALLIVNTLGTQGAETLVSVPRQLFQLITLAALLGAFGLALLLNRELRVHPNGFLLTLSLLVVTSTLSTIGQDPGPGATYRCLRFAVFVATIWLLSKWWSDALRFTRRHISAYYLVLTTVAVGLLAAPGKAMPSSYDDRLVGTLWPLAAPQVGQFAAVVTGLAVVLWLCRLTDGRSTLIVVVPAIALLLLSYTRTATIGLLIGIAVAGLSLVPTSSRARRMLAGGVLGASLAALAVGSLLRAWFRRGQDGEEFANLTGREKVWDALLAEPRTPREKLFGVGLTDKSYNGLPIDSSWLAVYHEQGQLGLALVVVFLAILILAAVLRSPSPQRGCAMFLVAFCLVASYTEAGLGDASPYLMHLGLAAALLSRNWFSPAPTSSGTRSPGVQP